jgi:aminodeoxyfutalosine synthase
MTTAPPFDRCLERVEAGERLSADDIRALATTPDILPLGMLADTLRRRKHDGRVTYLRVAVCAFDKAFSDAVPPAAREVRITGAPESLDEATAAVKSARAIAGDRCVSAFAWADVERLADRSHDRVSHVLDALRDAGLDAIARLPLDAIADPAVVLDRLTKVGFQQLRLSIDKAAAADRVALLLRAAALQDQFACIQTIDPLPSLLSAFRPTTGYEDVKMVAIARLAAPNVPTIQVDWQRYGPKLAQVALTFGADDIDNVSASDDAPEGRRRAPLEEIRRNIEAAGFEPAERDGRFAASSL